MHNCAIFLQNRLKQVWYTHVTVLSTKPVNSENQISQALSLGFIHLENRQFLKLSSCTADPLPCITRNIALCNVWEKPCQFQITLKPCKTCFRTKLEYDNLYVTNAVFPFKIWPKPISLAYEKLLPRNMKHLIKILWLDLQKDWCRDQAKILVKTNNSRQIEVFLRERTKIASKTYGLVRPWKW